MYIYIYIGVIQINSGPSITFPSCRILRFVLNSFVQHFKEFVSAIESICFGQNDEHHGTRSMGHTQSRACLAAGSLTRFLAKGGQDHESNRLADRLETWLDKHGKGVCSINTNNAVIFKLWRDIFLPFMYLPSVVYRLLSTSSFLFTDRRSVYTDENIL